MLIFKHIMAKFEGKPPFFCMASVGCGRRPPGGADRSSSGELYGHVSSFRGGAVQLREPLLPARLDPTISCPTLPAYRHGHPPNGLGAWTLAWTPARWRASPRPPTRLEPLLPLASLATAAGVAVAPFKNPHAAAGSRPIALSPPVAGRRVPPRSAPSLARAVTAVAPWLLPLSLRLPPRSPPRRPTRWPAWGSSPRRPCRWCSARRRTPPPPLGAPGGPVGSAAEAGRAAPPPPRR